MGEKEEFSFMEERVMESKRPQRQVVAGIKKSILYGITFGITAGICFCAVNKIMGSPAPKEEKIELDTSRSPVVDIEETRAPESSVKPHKQPEAYEVGIEDMQKFYGKVGKLANLCNRSIVGITLCREPGESKVLLNSEEQVAGVVVAKTNQYFMILTCYDAMQSKSEIAVSFSDGTVVDGIYHGADPRLGLAVIKVKSKMLSDATKKNIVVMSLSEENMLNIGDFVLAVGNPNGTMYSAEYGYVTASKIAHRVEDYQLDVYTTNISFYKEGYGIVCNREGNMVGILNPSSSDYNCSTFFGIGKLKVMVENILNNNVQNYAGVIGKEIPSEILVKYNLHTGIYVSEVTIDSPAYEAGILAGDVISVIEGERIDTMTEFYQCMQKYEPGEKISLVVIRHPFGEKKEKKIDVKIEKR